MARRKSTPRLLTAAQWEAEQKAQQQYGHQKQSSRRNKSNDEPDYDNMSLDEFGENLQESSQDCTNLAINSMFEAERAFSRGDKIGGVKHTATAAIGAGMVVYLVAELLGAAFRRD